MWEATHKIKQVTTAVDKVIPFSNGAVMKAGTNCEISSVSLNRAVVCFVDTSKGIQRLFLEYEFSELDYASKITGIVWRE